jgi:hypothetical protein
MRKKDFPKDTARTPFWTATVCARSNSMRASETHFAQISVEAVKKIATERLESNAMENDIVSSEPQNQVTSSQTDWRQLAQRVLQEPNPKKMLELAEQLGSVLDDEQLHTSPPMYTNSRRITRGC